MDTPIYLSIFPHIFPYIHAYSYPSFHHSIIQSSIHLSFIHPFFHLPIFLFMRPSIQLLTHLSIHPSILQFIHPFFYQFNLLFIFSSPILSPIHPFICLPSSVHPSVHLFNLLSLYSSFHAPFHTSILSFIHHPYFCHPPFQPSLRPSIHFTTFHLTNRC